MKEKFYFSPELLGTLSSSSIEQKYNNVIKTLNDYFYTNTRPNIEASLCFKSIELKEKEYIEGCCKKFVLILEKTYKYILSEIIKNKVFSEYFKCHEPYFCHLINSSYKLNYARFDYIIDENNILKFCETNSHGGGGFSYFSYLMHSLQNSIDLTKYSLPKYADKYWIPNLILNNIPSNSSGKFYITFSGDSPLFSYNNFQYIELMKFKNAFDHISKTGSKLCDARELGPKDQVCSTFSRVSCTKLNMATLPEYKQFLEIACQNNVSHAINLSGLTILQDKRLFSFIHENIDKIYLPEEREFIKKHIPKTYYLSHDINISKFLKNKNELILKPCNGARGENIVLGSSMSENDWLKLIKFSARKNYILQNVIKFKQIPYCYYDLGAISNIQCNYVMSSYFIYGKISGSVCRISPTNKIVNASTGAPFFPVIYKS